MANVVVKKDRYTVDPLYQWDKDQELFIYGLSLATTPEIHFTNDIMEKAIVRHSSMDDAGVIKVKIPNSLLQKPYKIRAYVCINEGETFKSLYMITIPVEARSMPADYTLTISDDEVYSFNALETKILQLEESNESRLREFKQISNDTIEECKEIVEPFTNINRRVDTLKSIMAMRITPVMCDSISQRGNAFIDIQNIEIGQLATRDIITNYGDANENADFKPVSKYTVIDIFNNSSTMTTSASGRYGIVVTDSAFKVIDCVFLETLIENNSIYEFTEDGYVFVFMPSNDSTEPFYEIVSSDTVDTFKNDISDLRNAIIALGGNV